MTIFLAFSTLCGIIGLEKVLSETAYLREKYFYPIIFTVIIFLSTNCNLAMQFKISDMKVFFLKIIYFLGEESEDSYHLTKNLAAPALHKVH